MKTIVFFALLVAANAAIASPDKSPAKDGPAFVAPAKIPAGVDANQTSTDSDYGYTKGKPIKVGSKDEMGGPTAEREYLKTLRDEEGKPVTFQRAGSVGAGPEGNILDAYSVVTSTGRTLTLYIDMYHPKSDPKKQPAPKGLFKAK